MALNERQAAALANPGIPIDDAKACVEVKRFGIEVRTILFVDKERDTFNGAPAWYASTAALGYSDAGNGLKNKAPFALKNLRKQVRDMLRAIGRELLQGAGTGDTIVAKGDAGIHVRRRLSLEELETLPREWLERPPAGD